MQLQVVSSALSSPTYVVMGRCTSASTFLTVHLLDHQQRSHIDRVEPLSHEQQCLLIGGINYDAESASSGSSGSPSSSSVANVVIGME